MPVTNKLTLTALLFALAAAAPLAHAGGIVPGDSPLAPHFDTIINGKEVASDDPVASTTVLLVGQDVDGSGFLCSGSIIDSDLVLTAAHCLGETGNAKLVAVFRTNIRSAGKTVRVALQAYMGNYPMKSALQEKDWDDLAVVRLAESIPAGYKAAKLLSDPAKVTNGTRLTLAGYGINVPVPPTEPNDDGGAGVLRKIDQTVLQSNYSNTELLVSLQQGGSCHGDSGGPALIQQGSDVLVVGVASRMTSNDQVAHNGNVQDYSCSVDMVYTSVLAQKAWINAAMTKLHSIKLQ